MFFRKDPRKKALVERALQQVEKMLWDMQDEDKDLSKLKLRKYQKTHFTSCSCPKCLEAKRKNNPHIRGILEDGFKVYVGEGTGDED
ncbi:MAG: hypothetical protein HY423_06080 [Candidatus Lambdaproteobacteria bacterium]|nr:hypothetical protein [Candidatus Lambdaproteobacteria bacterium]